MQKNRRKAGDATLSEHVLETQHEKSITAHARRRMAQRNVSLDAVDYVLIYGRVIQRTGITLRYLGWRDVPPDDRHTNWAARIVGTSVLVAADGMVITAYRSQSGLQKIRRKVKHRGQRQAAIVEMQAICDHQE